MDRTQVVDVTEKAREAGFQCKVVFSRAAWDRFICRPAPLPALQELYETYRLWQLLFDLKDAHYADEDYCPMDLTAVRASSPDGEPLITIETDDDIWSDFRQTDFGY